MTAPQKRRAIARFSVITGAAGTLAAAWLGIIRIEGSPPSSVAVIETGTATTQQALQTSTPVTATSATAIPTRASAPIATAAATTAAPGKAAATAVATAATPANAAATAVATAATPILVPAPTSTVGPAVPTATPRPGTIITRRSRAS